MVDDAKTSAPLGGISMPQSEEDNGREGSYAAVPTIAEFVQNRADRATVCVTRSAVMSPMAAIDGIRPTLTPLDHVRPSILAH